MVEHGADLGIAFDGDADRVIMVDKTVSKLRRPYSVYSATQAKQAGGYRRYLDEQYGWNWHWKKRSRLLRAKVGDRYVLQGLEEKGWSIGGEPSGIS